MLSEEQRRAYRLQDAEPERNLMPPPPEQRPETLRRVQRSSPSGSGVSYRLRELEALLSAREDQLRRLREAAEAVTRAWYEWSPVPDSAEFAAFGIDMDALDLALSQPPPNKGVPMTKLAEHAKFDKLAEAIGAHDLCMSRYPVEERVSFDVCSNPKCVEAKEQERRASWKNEAVSRGGADARS